MNKTLPLLFLTASLSADPALSGGVDVSAQYDRGVWSSRELMTLAAESEFFDLRGALSVNSDQKFGADIANFRDDRNFFDNYMLMEEGYASLHWNTVSLDLGRMRHADAFQSPYSLFINSSHPSAVGAVLAYEEGGFRYESRWIRLNDRSNLGTNVPPAWEDDGGFPDRGANIKTITFQVGDHRFGIQDAGVYTKRSFDLEYFISPVPEYFTQYYYGTAGRPWTTSSNENNLIGFFWQYQGGDWQWGAQVLIDDFNLYFLLPKDVPNNPWKVAWTVGADWTNEYGTWGLHQAGALKYTFEPIDVKKLDSAGSAYGYTLFPDTRYGVNGEMRSFAVEDNALGYQHGENSFAVMLTYDKDWSQQFSVHSSLEFVLAGANSPANPWQDAIKANEVGTHWLDDSVLQKSLTWSGEFRWNWQDWRVYSNVKLGYIFNVLQLAAPTGDLTSAPSIDKSVFIYRPSSKNMAVAVLVLGVSYAWDISATLDWLRGADRP